MANDGKKSVTVGDASGVGAMSIGSAHQRDLEWLGAGLRRVVEQQHGAKMVKLLEGLYSEPDGEATGKVYQRIATKMKGMDSEQLRAVIRYGAVWLDLMNLAEDRQRLRVLYQRERTNPSHQRRGSIASAVARWRQAHPGKSVTAALDHLDVQLVLTAHPTDAKRRAVRHDLRRISHLLAWRERPDLTLHDARRLEERFHACLTAAWQTDLIRPIPPTVKQEVQRGLLIAKRLWALVPRIQRDLREATEDQQWFDRPVPLRFGSWIGGDRDGHPLVGEQETAYALRAGRRLALRLHMKTVSRMMAGLSLSTRKQPVDEQMLERIGSAVQRWPRVGRRVEAEPPTELYRRLGRVIQWRLRQTALRREGGYSGSQELLDDARCMYRSLRRHRAEAVADDMLADWISQIRAFGLHMLALDVRQDSRVHVEVVAELLAAAGVDKDYKAADEARRRELLHQTFGKIDAAEFGRLSESARRTMELFRLLRRSLTEDERAIGGHVISMTHQVSDVLAVLWLLAAVREVGETSDPALQVIPLFETIDDLQRCGEVLDALFKDGVYRQLLARHGGAQTVMIGYSDSTKDGGYLAACWRMYQAQIAMHGVAEGHGVKLRFFHGRGGSLGRGGGPAAASVRSLPAHTIHGSIRITEQGEVLVERYDNPQIGYRHLEQVVAAALLTIDDAPPRVPQRWAKKVGEAAESSLARYHALVEAEGFEDYFRAATPIDQIEQLQIGSRPSRRRAQKSLNDLRAIPWVFAWTQSRHMIPAWYGLGCLHEAVRDEEQLELLRRMYRQWGFWRTTIDNAALAFAKLERHVMQRYARLAPGPCRRLCKEMESEAEQTAHVIERIVGVDHVLDNTMWLQDAVIMRNPYVGVLNMAQILLLERLREGSSDEAELADQRELLRKTIYGIATGLRTTG